MKHKKKRGGKLKTRYKIMMVLLSFFIFLAFSLSKFNEYLEPRLQALAKQQVNFAINNIAKEVLKDMEYDSSSLMKVETNSNGEIMHVDYDSYQLNQVLFSALDTIDESLLAAQDGKIDPTTEQVFYEDGIIYDVPVGYLTKISFLANVGPTIPVRMKLLNDVTGEIKVTSEAYGINNTMIKVSLQVKVTAQVITVLNVSTLETRTEIPIIMQLVNGRVPVYTPYAAGNEKAP